MYIWSDAVALELSNGSNGWFRFILDGKLATMYSSGSPEGGSDSSENRGEFLEKLQRARGAVRPNATTYPVFTKGNTALKFQDFSVAQILRVINCGHFEATKNCHFDQFSSSEF